MIVTLRFPVVVAGAILAAMALAPRANAVSIELKDVASDRIERQRAAAEGSLPLPGTPDLSQLKERLEAKGLKLGSPIVLRAFKSESEFEVWVRKDDAYVLFATYPVCNWSGTLGPKLREGDRQTPEGFYTVARGQIRHIGRWPRSLNLGFPNVYDKAQARSGSDILVHGGCSSVGCFAMTNAVIEEIYAFTEQALAAGQTYIPVHVFPFRMTAANIDSQKDSPWFPFWSNLKEGYDSFDRTKQPPRVSVCEGHYSFQDTAPEEGADGGPLAVCDATRVAVEALETMPSIARLQLTALRNPPVSAPRSLPADSSRYPTWQTPNALGAAMASSQPFGPAFAPPGPQPPPGKVALNLQPTCSVRRASCRHYLAHHERSGRRAVASLHRRGQRAVR